MATDGTDTRAVIRRYGRATRWLHAGVYVAVLLLLTTGGWLLIGREGDPSPLSSWLGIPDTRLHVRIGWAFAALVGAGLLLAPRGALTFLRESTHYRRSDLTWFARWPAAVLTGRFSRHDGRFDPGQRVANVALVLGLLAVTASGIAMALLHGGPAFVWLVPIHRWSTYLLVPLLAGHILIASGVLPGYRGVWRSMHLGGRLPLGVARRLWPVWTEAQDEGEADESRHPTRSTSRGG